MNSLNRGFPLAKYVGFYKMGSPALLIRDLDIVKDVLVKNVNSFFDNDFVVDPNLDPLLATSPFFTTGDTWKSIRSQVTPIFTVSKLRQVFPLTKHVAGNLVEYISCGPESNNKDGFEAKAVPKKYIRKN